MAEVELKGQSFVVAESIGLMPMMAFAKVAKAGTDAGDLDGLAALYDLLEQCIADEEWDRFTAHATKTRASGDELMGVVGKVFEALAARPTGQPSDSSRGLRSTNPSGGAGSSSAVVSRLEEQGRPDLALVVAQAQAARSA